MIMEHAAPSEVTSPRAIDTDHAIDNGIDLDALVATRDTLSESPDTTVFQWQAQNRWVHGTHSRTTIDGYVGGGAERRHGSTYVFDADLPELLAADDNGAAPVEFLLHALASCLTAVIATHAQQRGVQLRELTSTLSGDVNVAGTLGIDGEGRTGFSQIRVDIAIDADATPYEVRAIVANAVRRSAVFDTLGRGVDITTHVTPTIGG
jgi:uncharacterized OsmC-like protein